MIYNKKNGIEVMVQHGINSNYAAPPSHDVEGDRIAFRVDLIAPPSMTKEALVAHIVSGTIQNFPDITMQEMINGMLGAFDRIVWRNAEHSAKSDNESRSWISQAAQLIHKKTEQHMDMVVAPTDEETLIQRNKRLVEQKRRDLVMDEEEILRKKYEYIPDIKDMTFEGLKELERYTVGLVNDEIDG